MLRFCLAGEYPLDPSHICGGVVHAMYVLAQTFAEYDDLDFHVVTPAKGINGVKVVHSPGITVHYVGTPVKKVVPNLLTQPSRLIPVLQEIQPDIVNSHHCVTTLAAVRAGYKVLHTIHGIIHLEIPYSPGIKKIPTYLYSKLEQKAVNQADMVVAVAQYALDSYAPWINSESHTIYLPIEDLFWGVPEIKMGRDLIYAGAIGERKNLRLLIKAMPRVVAAFPDIRLHICGGITDKNYFNSIRNLIAHNGIGNSVIFHGIVDRDKLIELLSKALIMIIPSKQETTPTVICQTMAAGRVPIGTSVGAVNEMIEDGVTGFIVSPYDADALASLLIELLSDPSKSKSIGERAKKTAQERYERHRVAERILEICRTML